MPGIDSFQQSWPYPRLSDAPNIEAQLSALVNAAAAQTNLIYASATARNAAIPTPVAGMETWLIAEARKEVYSGSAWQVYSPSGTWADFVPVWTANGGTNPTLNSGTLKSRWTKVGRTVTWVGHLTCAADTNGGTGIWNMTIPVPAATTGMVTQGRASYLQQGVTEHMGMAVLPSGGSAIAFVTTQLSSAYSVNVSNTLPTNTAVNNQLKWTLTYESAS
ncbi:hypothetical protein [Streptomyces sp. CB03911]|uniref:hypothetical protein n=1 Tax=Streptomyces sp. CB03911 TaxID=1804758 RepID=UPI00093CA04B|nr:hypothetical protein [Streptomyces sp. CB03911]OKI19305.1 hypothetical protein A6A07_07330 [Streptomyces sp. CB03911]